MTNPVFTADGDLTAVPANDNQLRALGAAIGKVEAREPSARRGDHAANDNLPDVVAFTGVAGSGKSTATRYLVEQHGYTLVKFAGPLKDMLRAVGLSEREIEGDLKEKPSHLLCGRTPRYAMQQLGTQFGRDIIGDDFWIRLWRARVERAASEGKRVVVDDCRYPNEAQAIRKLGGDIFKLDGRGGIAGSHSSERLDFLADSVIVNDGPIEQLHGKIEEALRRYG
jgi:predicted kinase